MQLKFGNIILGWKMRLIMSTMIMMIIIHSRIIGSNISMFKLLFLDANGKKIMSRIDYLAAAKLMSQKNT